VVEGVDLGVLRERRIGEGAGDDRIGAFVFFEVALFRFDVGARLGAGPGVDAEGVEGLERAEERADRGLVVEVEVDRERAGVVRDRVREERVGLGRRRGFLREMPEISAWRGNPFLDVCSTYSVGGVTPSEMDVGRPRLGAEIFARYVGDAER
jgi:hypothetical protein